MQRSFHLFSTSTSDSNHEENTSEDGLDDGQDNLRDMALSNLDAIRRSEYLRCINNGETLVNQLDEIDFIAIVRSELRLRRQSCRDRKIYFDKFFCPADTQTEDCLFQAFLYLVNGTFSHGPSFGDSDVKPAVKTSYFGKKLPEPLPAMIVEFSLIEKQFRSVQNLRKFTAQAMRDYKACQGLSLGLTEIELGMYFPDEEIHDIENRGYANHFAIAALSIKLNYSIEIWRIQESGLLQSLVKINDSKVIKNLDLWYCSAVDPLCHEQNLDHFRPLVRLEQVSGSSLVKRKRLESKHKNSKKTRTSKATCIGGM